MYQGDRDLDIVIYDLELAVASLRIILILLAILVCIEIIRRSSGKFKKAFTFFLLALIPSIFSTIGRIIDLEARLTSGRLIYLILNALTTLLILIGLIEINRLLKNILKEGEKIDSGIIRTGVELNFLVDASKKFKKWALSQKNPNVSGSKEKFVDWLNKFGYGADEEEICKRLQVRREDFRYIFDKYGKVSTGIA